MARRCSREHVSQYVFLRPFSTEVTHVIVSASPPCFPHMSQVFTLINLTPHARAAGAGRRSWERAYARRPPGSRDQELRRAADVRPPAT